MKKKFPLLYTAQYRNPGLLVNLVLSAEGSRNLVASIFLNSYFGELDSWVVTWLLLNLLLVLKSNSMPPP